MSRDGKPHVEIQKGEVKPLHKNSFVQPPNGISSDLSFERDNAGIPSHPLTQIQWLHPNH